MDWAERINAVVAYVEQQLDGEIEMDRLARIAGCSVYNFQRLFSYIFEKPLAAFDVVRTQQRLIDIALRYGYESQDAFSRAFRQYHGVLPSAARREAVTLSSCPRIVFSIQRKEDEIMNYRVEPWPSFTIAGFKTSMRADESFAKVPQLWRDVWSDGRIGALHALFQQADYRPEGFLGVADGGRAGGADAVDYYQAVTTWVDVPDAPRVATPAGMGELTVPAATWIIFEADGDPFDVIQPIYKQFYGEWLPSSGYALADVPVIECYLQDNKQRIWFGVTKE